MPAGKTENWARDSQGSGRRSRTQSQIDKNRVSDDMSPIGQAGAGVRDAGRALGEVTTRHPEAKKVPRDLGRQILGMPRRGSESRGAQFQLSLPKL